MGVSEHMIHILHHTLGLRQDRREPYRNYFVAGHGHHDMPALEALEAAGLMKRTATPKFCDPLDVVFSCTEAGCDYAIEHLPPAPSTVSTSTALLNES